MHPLTSRRAQRARALRILSFRIFNCKGTTWIIMIFKHATPTELLELNTETINGKRHYITPKGKFPSITSVLGAFPKKALMEWRKRVGHGMPLSPVGERKGGIHILPYHTIPYHIISYHTIPYHAIPFHRMPKHNIL